MGRIFLADDLKLGRRVAIKLIREDFADDSQFVERFWREARAAAAIGHPNIVQVYEVAQTDEGLPYIVMEALEGHDLRAEIRSAGQLSLPRAVDIAGQVLFALDAAHRVGVVHRDLKPGNVFLARRAVTSLSDLDATTDGLSEKVTVKLLDFGISRFLQQQAFSDRDLTSQGDVLGTIKYMAPEQLDSSRDVDGRADLYALGVILYECVTGQSPFGSEGGVLAVMNRALRQPIPSVRSKVATLPEAFETLLARALTHDPVARYQSAAEFVEALRPFYSTTTGAQNSSPPSEAPVIDEALAERARRHVADAQTALVHRPREGEPTELDATASDETIVEDPGRPPADEEAQTVLSRPPATLDDDEAPATLVVEGEGPPEHSSSQTIARPAPDVTEPTPMVPEPSSPSSPRALIMVGIALVIAGIAAGVWYASRQPPPPARSSADRPTPAAVQPPVLTGPDADQRPGGEPDAEARAAVAAAPAEDASPTTTASDAGADSGGPTSMARALDHAEEGDFQSCLRALRELPQDRAASRLRRRCLRGARRTASRPHHVEPTEATDPPPESPPPVEPDEPFAREAPW